MRKGMSDGMKKLLPLFLAVSAMVVAAQIAKQSSPPEQPIPYSHKLHAGELDLKCNYCHLNSDPGERDGFPDHFDMHGMSFGQ